MKELELKFRPIQIHYISVFRFTYNNALSEITMFQYGVDKKQSQRIVKL